MYLYLGRIIGFEISGESDKSNMQGEIAASSEKIGTLTFIKENTNQFAALGHSTIQDNKTSVLKGLCYDINFDSIDKGTKDNVGKIVAGLNKTSQIGYIYYNSSYGILGEMKELEEKCPKVKTKPWYEVSTGKASIITALDEKEVTNYEVEITDIHYLNNNKNIKIKVKDEALIKKTGGIVQGMSGTPLMQDR